MEKNIGVDLGYGFVKVSDGKNDRIFPSVVGQARILRYVSDENPDQSSIKNLNVLIDDREYFVGDLANRQSEVVMVSLNENRMDEQISKVLVVTGLALLSDNKTSSYNIVTGLPVGCFSDTKQSLIQLFKGTHRITQRRNQKNEIEQVINVNEVKVVPQPFGTFFNLILDNNGSLIDEKLAGSKVGIIDIGFRTTDYIVVDNLENIDRLSGSTNTGLSTAYGIISELLKDEFKISKPIYQLDEIVKNGVIRISGKSYNLDEIKKHAFSVVAEKLITEVNSLWVNKWELDTVFITGGGGISIYEYMLPHFENISLVKGTQFANVYGFHKLSQRLYGTRAKSSSSDTVAVASGEKA